LKTTKSIFTNLINRSASADCKIIASVWETVAAVVTELAKERKCLQIHDHELERFEFSILESLLKRHAISNQGRAAKELFCNVVSSNILRPVEVLEPTVPAINRRRVVTCFVEVVGQTKFSTIVLFNDACTFYCFKIDNVRLLNLSLVSKLLERYKYLTLLITIKIIKSMKRLSKNQK